MCAWASVRCSGMLDGVIQTLSQSGTHCAKVMDWCACCSSTWTAAGERVHYFISWVNALFSTSHENNTLQMQGSVYMRRAGLPSVVFPARTRRAWILSLTIPDLPDTLGILPQPALWRFPCTGPQKWEKYIQTGNWKCFIGFLFLFLFGATWPQMRERSKKSQVATFVRHQW